MLYMCIQPLCILVFRPSVCIWYIQHSLVPRLRFPHPLEKWVWSTAYYIFVQLRIVFFSNLMKITFHIVCQQSSSKTDNDWATLVAVYRLGYCIFRKEHE